MRLWQIERNTIAPTIMMAEKTAEVSKQDTRGSPTSIPFATVKDYPVSPSRRWPR